ncbi:MAG: hypothetical protein WBP81_02165, partial [Solirubrobacteraceae bacterium]
MAVTAGDPPSCGLRTTDGCGQTTAGSGRRASLTDESRTAGGVDLKLLLLAVAEIVPTTMSDSATVGRVVRVVRPEGVDGSARSRCGR